MKTLSSKENSAQSSLEYAVLIICIVAALISMQVYVKRGMSGRLRQASDEIGKQYEPKKTTGQMSNTLTRESFAYIIQVPICLADENGKCVLDSQGNEIIVAYAVNRYEDSFDKSKTWGDEKVEQME